MSNILLFLSDDHAQWASGAYGNREIRTPALDHLAATGVQMDNAFTPTPVCSPARASLLTGHLASQHGIHDYLSSMNPAIHTYPWLEHETTLAQILSQAGYQTGCCGKWHLGNDAQPARGFDYWFVHAGDYPDPHMGHHRYSANGEIQVFSGFNSDIITDHSLQYLRSRDPDRPFFLIVGYNGMHSPWQGHPEHLVAYYRQCSFSDIPADPTYAFGSQNLESKLATRQQPHQALAEYYASVEHMDQGIGRILNELQAQDLTESTLIVYTSDHGLCCGHHGIWGKGNGTLPLNMVEESIRVPLILNQPKRLFGRQRRAEMVDHLDLFQTLIDYAGVSLPAEQKTRLPGSSFLHLAANSISAAPWREVQFGEYGTLRMIRTTTHKLVRRYPDGPAELFDLRSDPRETRNLFDQPENADLIRELTAQLEKYFKTYEDPLRSGLLGRQLPRYNNTAPWVL